MSKKPAHEIKLRRIKATVWANEGGDGKTRYNTSLTRIYKVDPDPANPKDSGWRESSSLGSDDLLLASKLLLEAHAWIYSPEHS